MSYKTSFHDKKPITTCSCDKCFIPITMPASALGWIRESWLDTGCPSDGYIHLCEKCRHGKDKCVLDILLTLKIQD